MDESAVDRSTEDWLDRSENRLTCKAWNCGHRHIDKHISARVSPLKPCTLCGKAEAVGKTHTVKHGDTLWKIAQTYLGKGGRYTEIVKLNGLKSNVLKSGQVLKIPEK